ncbi:HK97 gp10 family phage protein [Candidatus Microgenomates bacterium]|nr:MAG: HK97 gp10 family phage protein [Candidatus Microgenomates bacterium]
MAKMRIKYGNKGLERALKRFETGLIDDVREVIAKTATTIQSTATALAPVDEGNLKQSIDLTFSKDGLSAVVTVGAEYAIYVEYGTGVYSKDGRGRKTPWVYWSDKLNQYIVTRGMPAQPFWNPALDAGARQFAIGMKKTGRMVIYHV